MFVFEDSQKQLNRSHLIFFFCRKHEKSYSNKCYHELFNVISNNYFIIMIIVNLLNYISTKTNSIDGGSKCCRTEVPSLLYPALESVLFTTLLIGWNTEGWRLLPEGYLKNILVTLGRISCATVRKSSRAANTGMRQMNSRWTWFGPTEVSNLAPTKLRSLLCCVTCGLSALDIIDLSQMLTCQLIDSTQLSWC